VQRLLIYGAEFFRFSNSFEIQILLCWSHQLKLNEHNITPTINPSIELSVKNHAAFSTNHQMDAQKGKICSE